MSKNKWLFPLLVLILVFQTAATTTANTQLRLKETSVLQSLGLFTGTNKGPELEKSLTRAEASVIVLRISGDYAALKDEGLVTSFADVKKSHWAHRYIAYAAKKGYLKGMTPAKFEPNRNVTGKQFLTILLRAAGYTDAQPETAAKLAVDSGMLKPDAAARLTQGSTFIRNDMVEMMYAVLTVKIKNTDTTVLANLVSKGQISKETALATGLLPVDPVKPKLPEDPMDAIEQAIQAKLHGTK